MIRRLVLSLLLVSGLALPATAEDNSAAAAKAAADFYTVALSLKQGGIPDAKGRARLAPLISPRLERLLADGARAEASYARNTKGEAPPLLEGDLFTSLFEGASAFKLGACEIHGADAQCAVALSYVEKNEKPQHWTDTAVLIRTPEGWRLDDIDFGGNWPFANKGTLRENLTFAIHNASGSGE